MPLLRIPFYGQPKNKPYCVPACAKMVMAYHGRRASLRFIAKELHATENGVDFATLGNFFLRRGFKATFSIWHPDFPNSFFNLKGPLSYGKVAVWSRRHKELKEAQAMTEFVAEGGTLYPHPVSPFLLRAALRKKQPCFLEINIAQLLGFRCRKDVPHCVVVSGMTARTITVCDPNAGYGTLTYPLEDILYASYGWRGAALFVEPQRPLAK